MQWRLLNQLPFFACGYESFPKITVKTIGGLSTVMAFAELLVGKDVEPRRKSWKIIIAVCHGVMSRFMVVTVGRPLMDVRDDSDKQLSVMEHLGEFLNAG
jgi:hypothetical protein